MPAWPGKACILRKDLQLSTLRNTPVSDLHDWSGARSGLSCHIPSLQIFAVLCSDGGENAGFNSVLATIATKFSHFM